MRILVISRSAWRNDNSTGNTLTDFFSDFPDAEIFSLCMREQPPQNGIAKRHFFISEKQMINRLRGKKTMVGVEYKGENVDNGSEKAMYDAAKKHPSYLMYAAREILWGIGGWKNERLKQYIKEINPDVIFFPTFGCYYPHKILKYLHTLTDAKIMLFHADDHYTLKQRSFSPIYWLYRFGLRKWMRRSARIADIHYCISDVQKEDYDKAFGCECKLLTKFADFGGEPPVKNEYSNPYQLVFTGNVNINRWRSLALLVKVLERMNSEGIKAQLRIYTATSLNDEMKEALNKDGISFVMGSVPAIEIPRIQNEADILVHVESTDRKNRLIVRQSFSTKIVDYFKSARPIVAIGPKEVASIRHLIVNDCAIVADNEQELYEKLRIVLESPDKLQEYATQAYMCGRKNHDKKQQKEMLWKDLVRLTEM